ncbi:MAG: HD domain-containing protein [Bacilli bacterium]|nr:HD domain-containing protein [Bacilli bacterium]
MLKEDYKKVVKQFDKYYENYNNDSELIRLKYNHSYKVDKLMEELGKRLNLDEEHIYLSKIIGLLHDLGRFEQLKQNNSFSDDLLDHAEYAVNYLFKENHIRDFLDNNYYDSIIEKAIKNHNKLEIENNLTDEELFYSKMIRDMDKVDIYHQVAIRSTHKFDFLPSKKVINCFYEGKSVPKKILNNNSDRVIVYLAFLNDINFKESFEILEETNNFNEYIDSIEVTKWTQFFYVLESDARKIIESRNDKENNKIIKKRG